MFKKLNSRRCRPSTALFLLSFLSFLSLVACDEPGRSSASVAPKSAMPGKMLERESQLVSLVLAKFFLENPEKSEVSLSTIKSDLLKNANMLGSGDLDFSSAPEVFYRENVAVKSSPSTQDAPLVEQKFSVEVSGPTSPVVRGEAVRFTARTQAGRPNPEFQFAKIEPRASSTGIDEVPVFEHPPSLSNEFVTAFEDVGWGQVVVRSYDASGVTARAVAKVEVTNASPKIEVENMPKEVHRGEKISPSVTVTDPEGDNVSLVAELPDSAVLVSDRGVSFSIQELGAQKVSLTVRDEYGATCVTNMIINVKNRPPELTNLKNQVSAHPKEEVKIIPQVLDPDGDAVSLKAETSGKYLTHTPEGFSVSFDRPGDHSIRVTATDEHGGLTEADTIVRVKNRPPVISMLDGSKKFTRNQPLHIVKSIQDPDGDEFTATMTISDQEYAVMSTGKTPALAPKIGNYLVNILAKDSHGDSQSIESEIQVVNAPPSVEIKTPTEPIHRGDRVKISALSQDPDTDPILHKFTINGTSYEPSTVGELEFVADTIGELKASVIASDPEGGTATAERTVHVIPRPPVIELSMPSASGVRNQAFQVFSKGRCAETSEPVEKFEIVEPSTGQQVKSGEFLVSFPKLGKNVVKIKGTANSGTSSVAESEVLITNMPPVSKIIPLGDLASNRDLAVNLSLEYTDPDGSPRPRSSTWSVPSGKLVESDNNSAIVKFDTLGEHKVSVETEDEDGARCVSTTTIRVENLPPLVALNPSQGPFFRDQPIDLQISGSDPDQADGYPKIKISSSSPTFRKISDAGPVVFSETGSHTVKITATDKHGSSTSEEIELVLKNSPPKVRLVFSEKNMRIGENIRIVAHAEDLESKKLEYQFAVNGVRFPPSSVSHVDVELIKAGKNEVSVSVKDEDGEIAMEKAQVSLK